MKEEIGRNVMWVLTRVIINKNRGNRKECNVGFDKSNYKSKYLVLQNKKPEDQRTKLAYRIQIDLRAVCGFLVNFLQKYIRLLSTSCKLK